MNFEEAQRCMRVTRPSWNGFYVDMSKREIVYLNGPGGLSSTQEWRVPFRPTPAEIVATDWEITSG